ncbi:hypothetical protein RMN57_07045 [Kitasatospora sp. CM 4170]|uniref:Antibiotic biosynthesis monooxygenase n=1 Tax=Kitasatospora aburaviensis TaxID=67265 RepID=A0ABW1ESY9_9ACTN|nr:hypothetical protein [Kitasatospora sp. CM 4170]WNM44483.1 hypothetical protein RMN57_07045 [Kitasatospora sp. CM 4170]
MSQSPVVLSTHMMATYMVKPGCAEQARDIIAKHWPTLKAHGLVTDEPATVYHSESEHGPVFFEIVTWVDENAVSRAFNTPEVNAIWQEMAAITEAREGRPPVDYPIVHRMGYHQDEPDLPEEDAYTGLAHYLVRPDKVAEFHELMARDWPTLRDEKLTTGDRAVVYFGEDATGPFFLEVVRWYDQQGPSIAYRNDKVSAIWQDVFRYTEGRSGRPASEYLWAGELKFPYHDAS